MASKQGYDVPSSSGAGDAPASSTQSVITMPVALNYIYNHYGEMSSDDIKKLSMLLKDEKKKKNTTQNLEVRRETNKAEREQRISLSITTNLYKGKAFEPQHQVKANITVPRNKTVAFVVDETFRAINKSRPKGSEKLSVKYLGEEIYDYGEGKRGLKRLNTLGIQDKDTLVLNIKGFGPPQPVQETEVKSDAKDKSDAKSDAEDKSDAKSDAEDKSDAKSDAEDKSDAKSDGEDKSDADAKSNAEDKSDAEDTSSSDVSMPVN